MPLDTRDYYRDRLRSRTKYVERSDFRVSLGHYKPKAKYPLSKIIFKSAVVLIAAFVILNLFFHFAVVYLAA